MFEVELAITTFKCGYLSSTHPMLRVISMPNTLYQLAIIVQFVQSFSRTNMPLKIIWQEFKSLYKLELEYWNREWIHSCLWHCIVFCSSNWDYDGKSWWRCWVSVPWVWISVQSFKQCQAPHWRQAPCVHWLQLPAVFRSSEKQSCPE